MAATRVARATKDRLVFLKSAFIRVHRRLTMFLLSSSRSASAPLTYLESWKSPNRAFVSLDTRVHTMGGIWSPRFEERVKSTAKATRVIGALF